MPGVRRRGDPGGHPGHDLERRSRRRRSASASSPPRPNTNGSPPFSRTTVRPPRPCSTSSRVDLRLRHRRPAALLAGVDQLARRAARRRAPSAGSAGRRRSRRRAAISSSARARHQPGIARARRRPGRRSSPPCSAAAARRSSSPAPAASIRSATSRADARPRARRSRSAIHSEPSGSPTQALSSTCRPPTRARACAPTGVLHEAPSARVKCPLGAARRRVASDRRTARRAPTARAPRRAPRAPAHPGRRPARARRARPRPRVARPSRSQPGERQHERVDLARRRACAAACRRCRAARRPRGRRAARAAGRRAGGCWSRPAPRGQLGQRRARRRSRRADLRAGDRDELEPVGQLGRDVLGRVHGDVDLAVEQRPLELGDPARLVAASPPRSPEVVIVTSSASPPSRSATHSACASASALPRVPIRITAGGGRGARRTSARSLGRLAGASRSPCSSSLEPEQVADQRHARVDAVVAQLLHPHRRVVQQAVDDRAGDRLDALEVARRGRLPLARRSRATTCSAISVACAAQRRERRQHLERARARSRSCWISSSMIPSALRASRLAHPAVAGDHRLEVVDVVQRDALDLAARGVDVARHREVDQQHRPPVARGHHLGQLARLDQQVRRGGRGDDDVGALERLRAARRR